VVVVVVVVVHVCSHVTSVVPGSSSGSETVRAMCTTFTPVICNSDNFDTGRQQLIHAYMHTYIYRSNKKILFFYFFLNYGAYSSLSNRRYKNSVVHPGTWKINLCPVRHTQLFFIFIFSSSVSVSCEL
jgi:hypothetical protein